MWLPPAEMLTALDRPLTLTGVFFGVRALVFTVHNDPHAYAWNFVGPLEPMVRVSFCALAAVLCATHVHRAAFAEVPRRDA